MNRPLYLAATLLILMGSGLAIAQDKEKTSALTWTIHDSKLQWGPCPAFLPEGCAIAVLQGDPTKGNADVFFKIPAGSTIPSHWHTSAERMVLVSGKLHVTYDGHDETTLNPGSYAYGPAKLPHKAICAKGDPCILFIAFESPIDAIPVESAAE